MADDYLVVRPVDLPFNHVGRFYNPNTYISGWECYYKRVKYDEALNLYEVATSTRDFADVRMSTQYAFGMHEENIREENVRALWQCYVLAINGGVTKEQLEHARVSCTLPNLIMQHPDVRDTEHAASVYRTGGLRTMRERVERFNHFEHSADHVPAEETIF